MNQIVATYVRDYGTEAGAIRAFVQDLMAGDPREFKSGYSLENAVIAAAEIFDVSREEVLDHVGNVTG